MSEIAIIGPYPIAFFLIQAENNFQTAPLLQEHPRPPSYHRKTISTVLYSSNCICHTHGIVSSFSRFLIALVCRVCHFTSCFPVDVSDLPSINYLSLQVDGMRCFDINQSGGLRESIDSILFYDSTTQNERLPRCYFGRIVCFEFASLSRVKNYTRSGILQLTSDLGTIFGVRNGIQAE